MPRSSTIGVVTSRVCCREPAVPLEEGAGLVDRHDHGQPVRLPSSKSSAPQPGAMWTMPVPSSTPTSSQAITRGCDLGLRRQLVERAVVGAPDELATRGRARTMRCASPKTASARSATTQARPGPASTPT